MKKLYIIAGESSGDFLGAKILSKLSGFEIFIIGGKQMETLAGKSLFDIKEISVGGLVEILPKILKIKRLINKAVTDILKKKADIVLTIDSPGFNFRVAKAVRKLNKNIKLVHLVAPSVWAWRPKRAKKIAKVFDRLLTLFDFEPKYFEKYGLKTNFVGHPAIEDFSQNLDKKQEMILLMPGSRVQEINSLLPTFIEAVSDRTEKIVIPTLPHLKNLVKSISQNKFSIITSETEKQKFFKTAKFAIVASGTATLQLALSGCPMIVCYKLSNLTYRILKKLVKIKHISLVNIILNKTVVPELIQNDFNLNNLKAKISSENFNQQISYFKNLSKYLINNKILPSDLIVNILNEL